MKNAVRYCKNQGSEGQKFMKIHEKTTSEGKLRPNFRLSWLVRAQVGGKMGNLTLLGGLRGTKLEFPPYWSPGVPKAGELPGGFPTFFIFGFLFASQFSRMFLCCLRVLFVSILECFWAPGRL